MDHPLNERALAARLEQQQSAQTHGAYRAEPPRNDGADRLHDERALAARFGVSTRQIQRWRDTGEGPNFVRVGVRSIRYRERDVAEWLERQTFAHRAAELAQRSSRNAG